MGTKAAICNLDRAVACIDAAARRLLTYPGHGYSGNHGGDYGYLGCHIFVFTFSERRSSIFLLFLNDFGPGVEKFKQFQISCNGGWDKRGLLESPSTAKF